MSDARFEDAAERPIRLRAESAEDLEAHPFERDLPCEDDEPLWAP